MGTLGSLSYVYPSRLDAGVAVELGAPSLPFLRFQLWKHLYSSLITPEVLPMGTGAEELKATLG
jgi:hypothetical protein